MRGFRTKIALYIAFLLFLSALVTNILVVLFIQGVLVRDHLHQQIQQMAVMGRLIVAPPYGAPEQSAAERAFAASGVLRQGPWPAMLLVDQEGRSLFERNNGRHPESRLQEAVETVLREGRPTSENLGLMRAVFWWHPRDVLVTVPVADDGGVRGAMAAIVPLEPLYATLRQYNKPVVLIMLFNTAVLCLAGLYRIFRIYLRPIDRIVRQADAYREEEDMFFTFRREDDELNRLSSALNRMLKRIADDQAKLRRTVTHLEKANAELHKAQNEVIRSEKMAAVGRLAAGIAHEIGNPIGIVLGYLDLLRRPDPDPGEQVDFARRAESEIQRINTIISQLLDLARPKESGTRHLAAHEVIADILAVMEHQPMMTGITIESRLDAAADGIRGNGDQLRQVCLNVLLNAADAIHEAGREEQGRIRVETTVARDDGPDRDPRLEIAFTDNGAGIPEELIDTIFDPFYTTKAPGKGTGLGLAVSYMIVEQMGGAITVRSEAGQGTTLTLRLPLAADGEDPAPGDDAVAVSTGWKGAGTP